MPTYNTALIVGAVLSAIASALHLGIIVGGPGWYRYFGAGERLASAAAAGKWYPAIVTLGIATVLAAWSAYALSGAGVISPLPLLRLALAAITAVYLSRGLVLFAMLARPHLLTPFWIWSSLICLGFGLVHLLGLAQVWDGI